MESIFSQHTNDPQDRALLDKIFIDASTNVGSHDVPLQSMLDAYDQYKKSLDQQSSIRIYRLILQWGRSRPRDSVERSMDRHSHSVERRPRHRSSTASCSQEPPPLQPILIPQSPNSQRRNSLVGNKGTGTQRLSVEVTRAAEAGVTSQRTSLPLPPNIPKPPRRTSSGRPSANLQHANNVQSHFKEMSNNFQNENSENTNPNVMQEHSIAHPPVTTNPNIAFTPHFPSSPLNSFPCDASSISFVDESIDCDIQHHQHANLPPPPPPPPLQDRFVQQAERPHRPVLSMAIAREQAHDEIDLCAVQEERPRTPAPRPLPTPSIERDDPEIAVPRERKPVVNVVSSPATHYTPHKPPQRSQTDRTPPYDDGNDQNQIRGGVHNNGGSGAKSVAFQHEAQLENVLEISLRHDDEYCTDDPVQSPSPEHANASNARIISNNQAAALQPRAPASTQNAPVNEGPLVLAPFGNGPQPSLQDLQAANAFNLVRVARFCFSRWAVNSRIREMQHVKMQYVKRIARRVIYRWQQRSIARQAWLGCLRDIQMWSDKTCLAKHLSKWRLFIVSEQKCRVNTEKIERLSNACTLARAFRTWHKVRMDGVQRTQWLATAGFQEWAKYARQKSYLKDTLRQAQTGLTERFRKRLFIITLRQHAIQRVADRKLNRKATKLADAIVKAKALRSWKIFVPDEKNRKILKESLRSKAIRHQKRAAIRVWSRGTRRRIMDQRLQSFAQQFAYRSALSKGLQKWHLRARTKRTHRQNFSLVQTKMDGKLLRGVFRSWAKRARLFKEQVAKSEQMRRDQILPKTFFRWKKHAGQSVRIRNMQARCDAHLRMVRLDSVFSTWKLNAQRDREQILGGDSGPPADSSAFVMAAFKWMKTFLAGRRLEQLKRARKLGREPSDESKHDNDAIVEENDMVFNPQLRGWRGLWPADTFEEHHIHRTRIAQPMIYSLFQKGFSRQMLRSWRAITLLRKYQLLAMHYRRLRMLFHAYKNYVHKRKMNRHAEEQLRTRHAKRTLKARFGYWFRRHSTRKACRDELLTFRVNLNVRCTRNALQEWRRVASKRAQAHRNGGEVASFVSERVASEFFQEWIYQFEESRRFRLMSQCAELQYAKHALARCFEGLRWWSNVSIKAKIVEERRTIHLQNEMFRVWKKAKMQIALAEKFSKIVARRDQIRCKRAALATWLEYTKLEISLRARYQQFISSDRRCNVALMSWLAHLRDQKMIRRNEARADSLRKKTLLLKSWETLADYFRFSKAIGTVDNIFVANHTSYALDIIKSYTEQFRAYEVKSIGILFLKRFKRLLLAWKTVVRHDAISEKIESTRDAHSTSAAFLEWRRSARREKFIRQKMLLLDITRDKEILLRAMFGWRSYAHDEIRNRVITHRIVTIRERREAHEAFDTFKNNVFYYIKQRSALHTVSDRYEQRLRSSAMKRWALFARGQVTARAQAQQHDGQHQLASLRAWQIVTKKRISTREIASQVQVRADTQLARSHWKKWHERYHRRVNFRAELIKFRLRSTARQVHPILTMWQKNACALVHLRALEARTRKKQLKFAVVTWVRGMAVARRQTFALAKAIRRGSLYLERISLHVFKHALSVRKYEEQRLVAAGDRADIIRVQKTWLAWKKFLQIERRERALTEVADLGSQRFLQKRAMTGWLIYFAEWLTARYQLSEITKTIRIRELKTFIISWRQAAVVEATRRDKLLALQRRIEMRLAVSALQSWHAYTSWSIHVLDALQQASPAPFNFSSRVDYSDGRASSSSNTQPDSDDDFDDETDHVLLAEHYYRWRLAQKLFNFWRDEAPQMYHTRLDKIHAAQEWSNHRIDTHLVKCLQAWRSVAEPRLRVSNGARAVANTRRMRKALVSWRDVSALRKIAREHGEELHAVHDATLVQTCFYAYQERVARKRWLRLAQSNVQNRHDKVITGNYFVRWIKAVVYHGKQVMFEEKTNKKMLQRVLEAWRMERIVSTKTEQLRLQYLQFVFKSWRVVAVADKRRAWWRRNVLWHWRCAAKRRKWDRALVFHCRVARNRAILSNDFAKWHRRFDLRRRVRHLSSNRPCLQRGVFRMWREYVEKRSKAQRAGAVLAQKTNSDAMKKVWDRWGLLFAAKNFSRRHDPDIVQHIFFSWRDEVESKKLEAFVIGYHTGRTKRVCLRAMRKYAQRKQFLRQCESVLTENHLQRVLESTFVDWCYHAQRDADIRCGLVDLDRLRTDHLLKSVMSAWVDDFRVGQRLRRADASLSAKVKANLCSKAFKTFKRILGLARFAAKLEVCSKNVGLRIARDAVFKDVLEPIVVWRHKVQELGEKYPTLVESFAHINSYEKARPGLRRWHEFTQMAGPWRLKNERARRHARETALVTAFNALADYHDLRLHHRALDQRAARFLKKRVWPSRMRWAIYRLEQNRTLKREARARYEQFEYRCAQRRLSSALGSWYGVYAAEAKLKRIADMVRRRCAERRLFDTYLHQIFHES